MEVQISNWYIFQMVKYPKQSGCFCIPFFIHLDCCLPLNKILSVKNMVLFNHYRAFKPSLILIEFYSICYYQQGISRIQKKCEVQGHKQIKYEKKKNILSFRKRIYGGKMKTEKMWELKKIGKLKKIMNIGNL